MIVQVSLVLKRVLVILTDILTTCIKTVSSDVTIHFDTDDDLHSNTVETSVTDTKVSPFQDGAHPDGTYLCHVSWV